MTKKGTLILLIAISMLFLSSCSGFKKDVSNLIEGKYLGVSSSQALEISSQIYGSDSISSSEVKQMKEELMNISCRSVYFDFDSYDITADAKGCLDKVVDYLMSHPIQPIKLSGNTDPRGSEKYNFSLGQRRAKSVYDYLLSRGVSQDQICMVSYGELKLAARPREFYDELCSEGLDDSCMLQASEKAYYLDRRVDIDFGVKCS